MATLTPTIPTVSKNDWNSVIQFNRVTQRLLRKLAGRQLGPSGTPTYASLVLTGLTANRLLYNDSTNTIKSVNDLTNWIGGTTNQITVTDDGDGSVTLSTPQDIHITTTMQLTGVYFGGVDSFPNASVGTVVKRNDDNQLYLLTNL